MCSHKGKIQNISDGILILLPESCPKEGTLGAGVPRGGAKNIFFKHGHAAYQIEGNDEQNRMLVKILS